MLNSLMVVSMSVITNTHTHIRMQAGIVHGCCMAILIIVLLSPFYYSNTVVRLTIIKSWRKKNWQFHYCNSNLNQFIDCFSFFLSGCGASAYINMILNGFKYVVFERNSRLRDRHCHAWRLSAKNSQTELFMSFTNIQFLFYFISVFHVHVRIDWTATKEKKKPITYVYTHTHLLPMKMHRLKTLESCTLYAYILAHTTMEEKNSKNGFV